MPRIRTIKPEIASDVKLASLSIAARYTFVLLISQADDEGLIAGAHRQLLGALYPHDDTVTPAQLLAWVEELVTVGLLRWRTTRDGAPVVEIANWNKHQRVDNKGRSQLTTVLVPLAEDAETFAESRGESPRTAEARGYDRGPRTLDHGPPTEDREAPAIVAQAEPLKPRKADSVSDFLDQHDFGPFRGSVEGLIRPARNALAVTQTFAMHLSGEMGYEPATARELGAACQQYLANGEPFKPAFFAGFIRRAKRGVTRIDNRRRNNVEERRIVDEQAAVKQSDAEQKSADEFLDRWKSEHSDQYAEFQRRAEAAVPSKITLGREVIVRSQILRFIREATAA